ncbi:MAG: ABC transporter ATP-binding protein [Lachnospiraceae bacterium]|nr:ABC transporter ATP-binding protein [Lachnospiraceae bacterium]
MDRNTLKWLYKVPGKKRNYVVLLTALEALLGGSGVLYALILRMVVDGAASGDKAMFIRGAVLLVVLVAGQLALRALLRYFYERSKADLENIFKNRLFSVLLKKDYGAVCAVHSGEWMNRMTSDTRQVASEYSTVIPGAFGMLIKLVSALVLMVVLDPRFALLLLPVGLVVGVMAMLVRGKFKSLHKQIQEKNGKLRSFLQERLGGMLLIRAFAAHEKTERRAEELTEEHKAARMKRIRFTNMANLGLGVAVQGMYVFAVIWCGYGILTGRISYGTLTAMTQLISQVQTPFISISGYLPRWYAMLASAERLMEAEAFKEESEAPLKPLEEIREFYGNELEGIRFSDVSFTYPTQEGHRGTDALKHAELEVKKGEILAFTGQSGCGKSTLLKLLLAVYQPQEGRIELLTGDGAVPLTAAYRRLFAYVPQGNLLLDGTIRDAVSFASPERAGEDEAIWNALRIACADFVEELPEGLDTRLLERGSGLSEGQLQRLAIARAVFSESPVLLLDEATASLDGGTEERFLHHVRDLHDKTVLIVTHRPAALAICDRVLNFSEKGIC